MKTATTAFAYLSLMVLAGLLCGVGHACAAEPLLIVSPQRIATVSKQCKQAIAKKHKEIRVDDIEYTGMRYSIDEKGDETLTMSFTVPQVEEPESFFDLIASFAKSMYTADLTKEGKIIRVSSLHQNFTEAVQRDGK